MGNLCHTNRIYLEFLIPTIRGISISVIFTGVNIYMYLLVT